MSDEENQPFDFCSACKIKYPQPIRGQFICEPCANKCMTNFLELLLLEEAAAHKPSKRQKRTIKRLTQKCFFQNYA